jgi:hypothetical protein
LQEARKRKKTRQKNTKANTALLRVGSVQLPPE